MMFDPEFDPYEELMITRHNVSELVKGLNHQSSLFRELSQQHHQLIALTRTMSQRIEQLEHEVKSLKNT